MSIPQSRPIPRPGVSDLLRRLPAALLVAAGTCATLGVSASAQQLDANWLNPASGVWSDGSRWSTGPIAPNNGTPPGTTYRALFGATGSNYTVTLNSAVGVDEVAINSANATLSIVANGSLTLTGALTRTAGSLTLNGGSILGGTLDLNGGAVAVTSNTANLISGTTVNGGLTLSGFAFAPTVGLRLNNSTINGNVQVPFRTGTLRIENGLTLNGAATIGGNSSISFATTQTQTTGDFVLSTGSFNVATGQTLTLGGTARIRGRGTIDGGALVNGGVIQADEVGTSLQIRSSSFTNTGTLRALTNSTLDIYSGLTTAWTNQGSIQLQGGTVSLGGTINTADGFGTVSGTGTLNFVGTINNTGSVLPIVTGPTQRLLNGSINGGTVQVAPGAELRLGGAGVVSTVATLNGVTINGDSRALLVFAVRNGLNLNGTLRMNAGSTMWSHGNQSIVGGTILADAAGSSSTIRIGDTEAPGGQGTLTLSPTTLFLVNPGTRTDVTPTGLVNQGVIRATGANANLFLGAGSFNNSGLIEAVNGATIALSNWSSTGTIRVGAGSRIELGSFTTGATGTFENNGGIVALSGVVSNAGSTLSLSDSTGPWYTQGGRINGGTVNLSGSGQIRFDGPDMGSATRTLTLDGVTINGDMTLPNIPGSTNVRPSLRVRGDLGLNGTIRVLGSGNLISLENRNSNGAPDSINLSGGTIQLNPEFNGSTPFLASIISDPSMTLNIAPSAAIRGGNARFDIGTINNSGELSGNVEDANFAVNAGTLNNTGTIDASNFGRLNLNTQQFNNSGLIRVNYGSLTLGGTINLLPGTQFQRTGGTINLAGTLNNVGRTFVIDNSTGNINATGGTVSGGTVAFRDGRGFVFRPRPDLSLGLTLDGVAVDGDWDLRQANSAVRVVGDLSLNGVARINTAGFAFQGSPQGIPAVQTFTGTMAIESRETGNTPVGVFSVGNAPGFEVRIGPGSVIRGGGGSLGGGGNVATGLVVNQGLISADRPGYRLAVRTTRFTNQGTAEARAGGFLSFFPNISDPIQFSNTGVIRAVDGGTVEFSRSMSLAAVGDVRNQGGTVRFSGLDLQGGTLDLTDTTGTWSIGGIANGTVNTTGAARLRDLNSSGFSNLTLNGNTLIVGGGSTFSNVTMNGETEITGYLGLRSDNTINGTMRLSGSGATLRVESTGTTPRTFNSGTFVFDNSSGGNPRVFTGNADGDFTITLGAAVTIRGGNGNVRTNTRTFIVNNGLISADVAGQAITINTPRFTNNGTVEAINGGAIIYDPTLPPAGGSDLDPVLFSPGRLHIGPSSSFNLVGPLGLADSSVLMFTLSGAGPAIGYGRIASDFDLALDGDLEVRFAADFAPAVGARFSLLNAPSLSGGFHTVTLPSLGGDLSWDTSRLLGSGELAIVPAPGASTIFGLGAIGLCMRRRTRAKRLSHAGASLSALALAAAFLGLPAAPSRAQCIGFEQLAFPGGNGSNDEIMSLKVLDDGNGPALYATGRFTSIGGVPAAGIAKFNGASWSSFGTGLNGATDVAIYNDGSGPALYATGQFQRNNDNQLVNSIARWDGAAWVPVGTGLSNSGSLLTVYDDGGGPQLYVSGSFSFAGGVAAVRLARWNGAAWSPVRNSSYEACDAAEVCFDPLRGRSLLQKPNRFSSVSSTWSWDGAAWSQIAIGNPPRTTATRLVFDIARDRAVMFGGVAGSGSTNSTWLFDGTSWAMASPLVSPPARLDHAMAYDSSRQRVVVFGGRPSSTSVVGTSGDTWEWDGTNWTQVLIPGPSARFMAAMAFDSVRRRIVLFGGYNAVGGGSTPVGDTWEYDGTAWTQSPAVFGGARAEATMTFDPLRNRCVLHGGRTNSTIFEDTWVYDGATWMQAAIRQPNEPSHNGSMTFDALRGVVLQATLNGDTWAWNGSAWTLLQSSISIEPRAMLVHDDGSGPALYTAGAAISGIVSGAVTRFGPSGWSDVGRVLGPPDALVILPGPTGNTLVAGGSIASAGGDTNIFNIISWNGSSWSNVGNPTGRPQPRSLKLFDDGQGVSLYSGGDGFAKLVGNTWTMVSGNRGSTIGSRMEPFGQRLYLGGAFTCLIDGLPSNNIVGYGAPCAPPAILTHPADQIARFNQPIVLSVTAAGTPPLSFQWRRNGQPIPGVGVGTLSNCNATHTLSIADWTFNTAGSFDCVISNAQGQVTSNPAQVTVPYGPGVGPLVVSKILYPPETAPDLPVPYTSFTGAVVSDTGDVAFTGFYRLPNETGDRRTLSLWRNGTTRVLLQSFQQAPGVLPGITFTNVNSYGVAAEGRVYHVGELVGPNISTLNGSGIWRWSDAGGTLAARAGRPAGGVDPELSFSQTFRARICDSGLIGFSGMLDDGLSSGLWTWTPQNGQRLLAMSGMIAPGTSLPYAGGFQFPPVLGRSGRVAFATRLDDGGAFANFPNGLWTGTSDNIQLVTRTGDPAPGLPVGTLISIVDISAGLVNAAGDLCFSATTTNASLSPTIYHRSAASGQITRVVSRGEPAAGLPLGYTLSSPVALAMDASGNLLYSGNMQIPLGQINSTGLWFRDVTSGQSSLITTFRGVTHPTLPPEWTFESFTSASMSDQREVIFAATVTFGPGGPNFPAVFGWTPALGVFPIMFPSSQVEVIPGVFQTLTAANLGGTDTAFGSAIGSITSAGLVVMDCTFANGSRGIFSGQFGGFALRFFPCRADFNADGQVNADDLADFINCFFESPPCSGAEFNADGEVNADDLADYINVFFGPPC